MTYGIIQIFSAIFRLNTYTFNLKNIIRTFICMYNTNHETMQYFVVFKIEYFEPLMQICEIIILK